MPVCSHLLLLCSRLLALRGGEQDDLSPDGAIARRIRAELAAHRPLPDERFVVAETRDGRGKGLFVAEEPIEAGTYLFDYAGRVLDQSEYDARYPRSDQDRALAEYAVGIEQADGSYVYVDAADPSESNLARYMNHAEAEVANAVAWTLTEPSPRVLIFANQPLSAGVEIVWDYGRAYWEGRESEQI